MALLSQLSAPAGPSTISVETALLLILIGVVAVLFKELMALRRRMAHLESEVASRSSSPPARPVTQVVAPPSAAAHIEPEIFAVISAAVHLTYGARHRILAIAAPAPEHMQAWSTEGRRQVFQSHRVR